MSAAVTVLSLRANCMSAAAAPVRIAPDFTLSDQNGRQFTLSHYRGRPVVLFFGYTHCPDVCPTILANLKRARDVLGGKAHDVVVALVTVDPERDTSAELRQFVTVFDPSFLGLRGTRKQLVWPVINDVTYSVSCGKIRHATSSSRSTVYKPFGSS